ncbi:MAG: DNA polymerase I, partial [Fibrobacterota bacterium]
MDRLYLIDGMALAYRGFFAFIKSPLRNSKGQNVSAVYSFLVILQKLITEEKAERMAVVFDTDRATFRRELYKEYKAHRPPMPDELREQIPLLLRLLAALRITVLQQAGMEADDIIGTLAVKMSKSGGRAFILSKDKDFAQVINENIILMDPKMQGEKTVCMGAAEVEAKFGLLPEKIVDYLALIGDASDNVPGVPKVGPKTAVELIREYGSLDGVYAALDRIKKPALKKTLSENRELAFLSRTLVTLKTDLDIPLLPLRFGPPDDDLYIPFLKEMEFGRFLKEAGSARTGTGHPPVTYAAAENEAALAKFVAAARAAGAFAIDTETDGLESRSAGLAGISLSCAEGEALYVPVGHLEGKNLPLDAVRRLLAPLLESDTIEKAGHNLKFDLAVLTHHGFTVTGPLFDTLIAAYVLAPGVRQYGLDDCALEHFDIVMQPITALIGEKKKEQIPFSQVTIADAAQYSCADADMTLRLRHLYTRKLEEAGLTPLFRDIEMPLVRVLLAMEYEGICIDREFLKSLSVEYEKILSGLHQNIIRLAGREFNLNSPKQLQEILFDELKIPPLRKLKTGFSTDADVLEALAIEHELPRLLLQHRKYTKLKSTYVDALPLDADTEALVHTSFNQTVTATGRLSSSNPNLQNIPVKTEEGREIRKAFVPRKKENVLVSG